MGGWVGGVCFLEGHGVLRLEDNEAASTLFIPLAWGTPHEIYCEPGPSPQEQSGYFEIFWYGELQYGPRLVNDASILVIPAAIDSYEANSDWCARSCTLAWDGKCRYFAYDSVTKACRFYAEKGGCYDNPDSWTGRNADSTAYLVPKEFPMGTGGRRLDSFSDPLAGGVSPPSSTLSNTRAGVNLE